MEVAQADNNGLAAIRGAERANTERACFLRAAALRFLNAPCRKRTWKCRGEEQGLMCAVLASFVICYA